MSILLDMLQTHYKGVNENDLDLASSVFDENVRSVTPNGEMVGIAAFRQMGETFMTAAPDARLEPTNTWEVGDTIIVEGVYAGTHTGPLMSPDGEIPATGKAFSFPFVDILRADGNRFVEHRIYWDNVTFLGQLGVLG